VVADFSLVGNFYWGQLKRDIMEKESVKKKSKRQSETTVSTRSSIRQWNRSDRPREKLMDYGRRTLSDVELMAILIGSGSQQASAVELCRQIMDKFDHDLQLLGRANYLKLCDFPGMGPAKAVRLIAALELGRRRSFRKSVNRPVLNDSLKVYEHIRKMYQDLEHEESWVLYLNSANHLIHQEMIGKGGNDFTPMDIKTVLRVAMESKSSCIILTHNHPSGTLYPSQADISLTDRLQNAATLCDIDVLDHIIYTDKGYVSFRDDGYLD